MKQHQGQVANARSNQKPMMSGVSTSLFAIVGPNGGGKSTLLKAVTGQLRPEEGRIDLRGLQPGDIAYLPQQADLDRRFPASVFDVVATDGITPLAVEDEHEEEAGHENEEEHGHDHHHHGDKDPHARHSLANGAIYANNIEDGLIAIDPGNAADYRDNGKRYRAEIRALDQEVRQSLDALPAERRTIVTLHDAFGYFADSYDLTFLAPQGWSTESEASAADVAALIRQIRDERISAVFIENVADSRLIEQITRETDAVVGGIFYSDALSSEDGPASTYLDMFRHHVGVITAALGS